MNTALPAPLDDATITRIEKRNPSLNALVYTDFDGARKEAAKAESLLMSGIEVGPVAWPVLCGLMPPVADAYIPRAGSGLALAGGLNPGETVVLVTAGDAARVLGGLGGTGKTQLALAIARALISGRGFL